MFLIQAYPSSRRLCNVTWVLATAAISTDGGQKKVPGCAAVTLTAPALKTAQEAAPSAHRLCAVAAVTRPWELTPLLHCSRFTVCLLQLCPTWPCSGCHVLENICSFIWSEGCQHGTARTTALRTLQSRRVLSLSSPANGRASARSQESCAPCGSAQPARL